MYVGERICRKTRDKPGLCLPMEEEEKRLNRAGQGAGIGDYMIRSAIGSFLLRLLRAAPENETARKQQGDFRLRLATFQHRLGEAEKRISDLETKRKGGRHGT